MNWHRSLSRCRNLVMNCRNRVMNCETIHALSKTKHSVLVYFQISPHICVLCVPACSNACSITYVYFVMYLRHSALALLCACGIPLSLSLSLSLSLYMYFVCLRYSSRSLSLSLPLSLLSLDVFVCLISPRSFCIHKCPRKIVLALCAACVLRLQVVV